MPIFF